MRTTETGSTADSHEILKAHGWGAQRHRAHRVLFDKFSLAKMDFGFGIPSSVTECPPSSEFRLFHQEIAVDRLRDP